MRALVLTGHQAILEGDFFISSLADKGVAMHILMALAGHKNLSTTQRYISLNPNLMRAAVELI
jgi:integrase/recombinase XerD